MELLTPRTWVGMAAVFLNYFQAGLYDATLSPYVMQNLQLHSVGPISIIFAYRSLMYLVLSYACAEIMRRKAMSFERLIMIGCGLCITGFTFMAPQVFLLGAEEMLLGSSMPLKWRRWALQCVAVSFASAGPALLFSPSLPLMQSEAKHLGDRAVEQTASLFMAMMSLGEACGPIVGGLMVEKLGFRAATALAILPYAAELAAAAYFFDAGDDGTGLTAGAHRPLLPPRETEKKASAVEHSLLAPLSGDSAIWWRTMTSSMEAERWNIPGSAPCTPLRRAFNTDAFRKAALEKPYASMPSTSFRRAYSAKLPQRLSTNAAPCSSDVTADGARRFSN